MPWFKVDDKLHDHRKARRARKAAMGVWVLAGSWCMDHLTDGFVPESVLNRWGNARDAAQLCEANLWTSAEKDGENGWQFCNWADFQPSKAEVESERAATKERVQKWRESKRRNGVTSTVTHGVSDGSVTPEVRLPRPDPTRPDPSTTKERAATQPRRAPETAIPDDWQPTDQHRRYADTNGLDLAAEAFKFRNHAVANDRRQRQWNATFSTWLAKAVEFAPKQSSRAHRLDLPEAWR